MSAPSETSARQDIVRVGRMLAQCGLVAGTDGNLSVRLDAERILITPSGLAKGRLQPEDMVIVDHQGAHIDGAAKPSSEMAMHLFIYRQRPEMAACVHAHPPHATAFAVAGAELPEDILPEVAVFVGRIPLTEYAPPGTEAVPNSLAPFVDDCNAFLLRNHGVMTIGQTLEQAYNRLETVEQYAKILYLARTLGDIGHIPPADLQRLRELRHTLQTATGN